MTIQYNAREVYDIGIEIEKNGKAFYDAATLETDEPGFKKLFSDLSKWEDSHVSLFKKLKSELKGKANDESLVFDPNNESALYLKATADSHVFKKNCDIPALVKECKSPINILKLALQFEKDSIVLYSSMMGLVPQCLGQNNIQKLINEEIKHVALLQDEINKLV